MQTLRGLRATYFRMGDACRAGKPRQQLKAPSKLKQAIRVNISAGHTIACQAAAKAEGEEAGKTHLRRP